MNERTHFFTKIDLSHFILERVMFHVCERWVETSTDSNIDPVVLLSHLGWVAQPWVTEGPEPSVYRWLSIRHLVSNWLHLQLTQAVSVLVIFLFDTHLLPLFFRLFTQVHLLIDSSVEDQYVTKCSNFRFELVDKFTNFLFPSAFGSFIGYHRGGGDHKC